MGRGNTCVENIRWGFPLQCLSRSGIQFPGHDIQLSLANSREIHSLRVVLSQEPIRVLVASALPRARGIAEVDLYVGCDSEFGMIGELRASIPGQ